MNLRSILFARIFSLAVLVLITIGTLAAQEGKDWRGGLVEDWSSRHLIFSNPGTEDDAWQNGKLNNWDRIVNSPRYQMQEIRRKHLWADWKEEQRRLHKEPPSDENPIERDWSIKLTPASASPRTADGLVTGAGVADGVSPAKYTFAPIATPNCSSDYVAYPISRAGSTTQANILGVNNLYKSTCFGTTPAAMFAYYVGTGLAQTSPVLSLDGTKIAFVESSTSGSILHVLVLGTNGNSGCPGSPCNGNAYNTPVQPATKYAISGSTVTGPTTVNSLNNAIDYQVKLSGSPMDTRSSPFVDYENDIAYVGDDNGVLHKITPVFNSTPSNTPKEVISGWPVTIVNGGSLLSGPVFDGGASQSIFVGTGSGTSSGSLFCVKPSGAFCATKSVAVGTGVVDPPIVDSTNETVFIAVNSTSTDATLEVQTSTSLGNVVSTSVGSSGYYLHDGAFDNNYYNNPSSGYLYVCGSLTNADHTPTLWRIGFNSNGTMKSTNTGQSFPLMKSGDSVTASCSPFTEIYNPTGNSGSGEDLLFLSVPDYGFNTGAINCGGNPCVVSFDITNGFPAAAKSALPLAGSGGTGGIVIDGISSEPGASQIYFGTQTGGTGMQVSQSGLQ